MSNELKSGPPAQTIPATPVALRASANPAGKAAPNRHDELCLLVNSRHPIITVETTEEGRIDQLIFDVGIGLGDQLTG